MDDLLSVYQIAAAAMAGEWQHHQAAAADIVDDNLNFALGSHAGDVTDDLHRALGSDGGDVNDDNLELALGSDAGDQNDNLELALVSDGGDLNDNLELALGSDAGDVNVDDLHRALVSDAGDLNDNLELALVSDAGDVTDNLELALGSDGSFDLLWPQNQPDHDDDANNTATATPTVVAAAEEEDNCAASGYKRKRHSREQIQHLEAAYHDCPHPDDNQRRDLSERLGLTLLQVKFWFQNRRSSNKSQVGREESRVLREENDALRGENESIREAIIRKTCMTCGGPTVPHHSSSPEQRRLRLENARLKDELRRAAGQAAAAPPPVSAGGHGMPVNLMNNAPRRRPVAAPVHFPGMRLPPPPRALAAEPVLFAPEDCGGRGNVNRGGALQRYVLRASDELRMLASKGRPMWLPTTEHGEVLNGQEYADATYPGILGNCPPGYAVDGTRETGFVLGSGADLVGVFTDAARWSEMFPDIVVRVTATPLAVPKPSRHGLIQLVEAELRVLSPRLPLRRLKFIRHSQMLNSGVWMVVDVSTDGFSFQHREGTGRGNYMGSRMLPSGCLIEDMKNGYCKVTWIMIAEYDETAVLPLYHPLLRSGTALGARRWLASLRRQCEYLAVLASDPAHTLSSNAGGGIPPEGRNGVLDLARRMTACFHAAMSGPGGGQQPWTSLDEWGGGYGVGSERFDLAVRFVTSPAPAGAALVLTATTTVWLPGVPPHCVFDYLCDGERRGEWDVLAVGAPVLEQGYVATGQIHGNTVSVLRLSGGSDGSSNNKLILQEARIDASGMLLAYAPVAEQSMAEVMKGHGAAAAAPLFPSGFVILPDGHSEAPRLPPSAAAPRSSSRSSSAHAGHNAGSLVSAAYQTVLMEPPPETVAAETIERIGNMLCRAVKKVKDAVHASIVVTA